jgi:hypothetical protein
VMIIFEVSSIIRILRSIRSCTRCFKNLQPSIECPTSPKCKSQANFESWALSCRPVYGLGTMGEIKLL